MELILGLLKRLQIWAQYTKNIKVNLEIKVKARVFPAHYMYRYYFILDTSRKKPIEEQRFKFCTVKTLKNTFLALYVLMNQLFNL